MTDYAGFALQLAGLTLLAAGFVWLLCRTFSRSQAWGTAIFFLPPLALPYLIASPRRLAGPLVTFALGAAALAAPYGIKWYARTHIQLGERIREVDGETHVTLTGWDQQDYGLLEHLPETVVLQMANPDVTDATLEYLRDFTRLRELDLNDSQVTDEGLKRLGGLPRLQMLRLRGTKVTDAGFRASLLPVESLRSVEVTGTAVKGGTLREWKSRRPGRDYLN